MGHHLMPQALCMLPLKERGVSGLCQNMRDIGVTIAVQLLFEKHLSNINLEVIYSDMLLLTDLKHVTIFRRGLLRVLLGTLVAVRNLIHMERLDIPLNRS